MTVKKRISTVAGCVAGSALVLSSLVAVPTANAQSGNPYARGPAPSNSSIEASRGPYAVSEKAVRSASGFGGGDLYYPTSTSDGTFGVVAVSPGFTASKSTMAWLAPRIASQGFVVFNIDTNTRSDQPASRGRQLLAALDYAVNDSTVGSRIDRTRQAVIGHSMGGGGTLTAASERPALKAAIPLTGWHGTKNWSRVQVPTLVVGAENDSVASVRSHSEPFYESLGGEKAYLELAGASHFAPNSNNTTIAKYSISWLKRFVDNDARYDQFLCGANVGSDRAISEWQDTCPFPGGSNPAPGNPGNPGLSASPMPNSSAPNLD